MGEAQVKSHTFWNSTLYYVGCQLQDPTAFLPGKQSSATIG